MTQSMPTFTKAGSKFEEARKKFPDFVDGLILYATVLTIQTCMTPFIVTAHSGTCVAQRHCYYNRLFAYYSFFRVLISLERQKGCYKQ